MFKMHKLFITTAILSLLVSCSSKHEVEESKGLVFKTSEILVRQCNDISNLELNELFEEHEVTIKKQLSPHLYIITWSDDDRSADEVVHELKKTYNFCGVDKSQEQ